MKSWIAALILMGFIAPARADQLTESAQQALKDQGFYYGEVTGQKSANLSAAIRRYQIRNGLQVTGELNAETLRSLGLDPAGSSRSLTKSGEPASSRQAQKEQPSEETPEATAAPDRLAPNPPSTEQIYPARPAAPESDQGKLLAGTPFESAPPSVQRNVIVSAQMALARRGFYRAQIDGLYGPSMEFSLRAYQARTKLPVTGRLDLPTLAALRLLPPPRGPFYDPLRRRWQQPGPPVRGEWVPE
jgi:peptidoglycan hydrolase-like protein with peptidoglycan-binding domain